MKLAIAWFLVCAPLYACAYPPQSSWIAPGRLGQKEARVNVTLYVMSRCPDARLCERVFEDVLQADGIQDKINLDIGFIATRNASEALGYSCKHGELECIGDAHQLCLHAHLPLPAFYATLACMNYGTFPGDIGKLALTRQCAKAGKVDWWGSGVGGCIEGKKGLATEAKGLFRENVERTIRDNITQSCTVSIRSTVKSRDRRCVVDAGVWKGCDDGHSAEDFIRVIEEEWQHLQH